MNILFFSFSIVLGFIISKILTKNGSGINKKLPHIRIKFLELVPHVKIHMKNKSFHIHHWITYSIVLIITLTFNAGVLDSILSKGFLVGGILQGLSFPDWKKVVIKNL